MAPTVSLEFGRIDLDNTDTSCSNTVFSSTVTWSPSTTCPALAFCADGFLGGTSSTNFEPNTVDEAMSRNDAGMANSPHQGRSRFKRRPATGQMVDRCDLADLERRSSHLGVGIHRKPGRFGTTVIGTVCREAAAEQTDATTTPTSAKHLVSTLPGPRTGVSSSFRFLSGQVEGRWTRMRPAR